MHVLVNGVRLFFDVEGAKLVPDGPAMREKPTLLLLHGGPASITRSTSLLILPWPISFRSSISIIAAMVEVRMAHKRAGTWRSGAMT
jgi:hypothetical protein